MSTREELADTIAVALRGEDQFGYTDISDLSDAVLDSRYDLLAVADAVLADYQRKPRTVDSAAELKAESDGTILRDEHGMVGVIASAPDGSGFRYVLMVGDPRPYTFASWAVSPSIVLFTPEVTA